MTMLRMGGRRAAATSRTIHTIHVRTTSRSLFVAAVALWTFAAPRIASAEWPQFGRPVTTASRNQQHSAAATDGAGGAVITWQDDRFKRVNIFAGHVLASGDLDPAWPEDGLALLTDTLALPSADVAQIAPVIISDGAGGAIVAWQDLRDPATDLDLFAQHVLASGVVDRAWPANGVGLTTALGVQNLQAMVPDGVGGAIVTWQDARSGVSEVDVYAQHVLATGRVDPGWPANGLAVAATPGRQEFPIIAEDGAGGAIIAWQDSISVASGLDVFAQHVLSSGLLDPAWPAHGRAVVTAAGAQGRGSIAPDGAHGAILAWTDGRVANTFHIFAQHVLANGAVDPAWPVNGRAISNAGFLESRPLAVPDGRGGAVVTWQALSVHLNMFAQHVTAAGILDPAWPAGGRALSITARQQSHAEIVADGRGGAVVAWEDSFNVVAQHVLGTGALDRSYPDTGLQVVDLSSQQGDVALVATGGGGAIVTWTDGRNGKDADIYAMQVTEVSTLTLDVPPGAAQRGISFASPSPNPARASLTLRFSLPREAPVRLAIYDVSGRRVRQLASGAQPAGEHAISWDLRDDGGRSVGTGLYFARLEVQGSALTRALATLR